MSPLFIACEWAFGASAATLFVLEMILICGGWSRWPTGRPVAPAWLRWAIPLFGTVTVFSALVVVVDLALRLLGMVA